MYYYFNRLVYKESCTGTIHCVLIYTQSITILFISYLPYPLPFNLTTYPPSPYQSVVSTLHSFPTSSTPPFDPPMSTCSTVCLSYRSRFRMNPSHGPDAISSPSGPTLHVILLCPYTSSPLQSRLCPAGLVRQEDSGRLLGPEMRTHTTLRQPPKPRLLTVPG